jgi:hypothetical protein
MGARLLRSYLPRNDGFERLHQHISTSPNRRIAESPNRRITESPNRRITESPKHRIAESPNHRITESSNRRIVESMLTSDFFLFLPKIHPMTAMKKKKAGRAKRKKIRFRRIVMKMTDGQKRKVTRYCTFHRTTMNRLIKKAISEYIDNHGGEIPESEPVPKNQLKLFDAQDLSDTGKQMDLFEH